MIDTLYDFIIKKKKKNLFKNMIPELTENNGNVAVKNMLLECYR